MDLLNTAKKAVGFGGDYFSLDKIQELYPEGVTLTGCFYATLREEEVPAFKFAENENGYFFAISGGLKDLFEECLEDAGSIENFDAELKKTNLKIRIRKKNIKNGKKYTQVTVLAAIDTTTGEVTKC